MPYLTAAVVLVGVVSAFNLLLTVGVIRRLHAVTTRHLPEQPGFLDGLTVGQEIPDFVATTTDGERVSRELFDGPILIGFFSPGCPPCAHVLPRFTERAREATGEAALAVIVTPAAELATDEIAMLDGAARVVVEEPDGPLQKAFAARGFPTVYLVGADGTVSANTPAAASLVGA